MSDFYDEKALPLDMQEGLTDVRFYQSSYVLQLWNSAVAEVFASLPSLAVEEGRWSEGRGRGLEPKGRYRSVLP